ncbi:Uma2 family endonuclease [Streptomyces sp. ODS28]|uniref:Uma2 family endonuclease n=1 Tax=Streptomyces sp. ODS28 TaxID=3136688 RepID=UPI0031EC5A29
MSALSVDHTSGHSDEWDEAVRLWEETDAPEGCKVEIIEGIVTVSPPPANNHNEIAELVHRRLYSVTPEHWGVYQTLGVAIPSRTSLFMPDLTVVAREVVRADGRGNYVPAAATELVVEVTSRSNANQDRIVKAGLYAWARAPLYLLVDRFSPGGPTATLYGEPRRDLYRVLSTVKFGEELHLPKPFELTLDTSVWPTD